MSTRNWWRTVARATVPLLAFASLGLLGAPDAAARSGQWGVLPSPFTAGIICSAGATTSPLASWNFGVDAPAYLTAPVTSDGSTDSAALPFPNSGVQQRSTVVTGSDGFVSDAEIATYAALLSRFGRGGDAQVAAVADLVMQHSSGGSVPGCGAAPDGSALLASATAAAGPYTVAISVSPRRTIIGEPATVSATVRGGRGQAVPGLRVRFSSSDATLGRAFATTDGAGRASVPVTVPPGSVGGQVTAEVSAPVGLQRVTISTARSPTNPTGTAATALFVAPPAVVSSTAAVVIDPTADPRVTTGSSIPVLAVGGSTTPTATITGLRGHSSTLAFNVRGPLPLDGDGLCASPSSTRFTADTPVTSTSANATFTGDRLIRGSAWSPQAPGCYVVQAELQTTDATPAAKAASKLTSPGSVVTVIAATTAVSLPKPVVGAGAISATVTPTKVPRVPATLTGRLVGPRAPDADGSCALVDWTGAPAVAEVTADARTTSATTLASPPQSAPGCYRWSTNLDLDIGGVVVPVPSTSSGVLLLVPQVSVAADRTWTINPKGITTHVTVGGTYGQAAHVQIRLVYSPSSDLGCRTVNWSAASTSSRGQLVSIKGDGEVAAESGPTPTAGCYAPIPFVTIDANTEITATNANSLADNAVISGIAAQRSRSIVTTRTSAVSVAPIALTAGLAGVLEIVLVVIIAAIALGHRGREDGAADTDWLRDGSL